MLHGCLPVIINDGVLEKFEGAGVPCIKVLRWTLKSIKSLRHLSLVRAKH